MARAAVDDPAQMNRHRATSQNLSYGTVSVLVFLASTLPVPIWVRFGIVLPFRLTHDWRQSRPFPLPYYNCQALISLFLPRLSTDPPTKLNCRAFWSNRQSAISCCMVLVARESLPLSNKHCSLFLVRFFSADNWASFVMSGVYFISVDHKPFNRYHHLLNTMSRRLHKCWTR